MQSRRVQQLYVGVSLASSSVAAMEPMFVPTVLLPLPIRHGEVLCRVSAYAGFRKMPKTDDLEVSPEKMPETDDLEVSPELPPAAVSGPKKTGRPKKGEARTVVGAQARSLRADLERHMANPHYLSISKAAFSRVCKDIVTLDGRGRTMTTGALEALQHEAEGFLSTSLMQAQMASYHAKRQTIDARDMRLIEALRCIRPGDAFVPADHLGDKPQASGQVTFQKGPAVMKRSRSALSNSEPAKPAKVIKNSRSAPADSKPAKPAKVIKSSRSAKRKPAIRDLN